MFNSDSFLTNNNPWFSFPYFYYNNSVNPAVGVPCTTQVLESQFPNIRQFYPDNKCDLIIWIKDVKSFQINTGRFYTKENEMIVGMNISIKAPNNTRIYNITMDIPMDNLYIQVMHLLVIVCSSIF
jgi:hypothetical protein